MNEEEKVPMTPEEATALKTEVSALIDDVLSQGLTKDEAVEKISEGIEALKPEEMPAEEGLGGLGMKQGMGNMEGMAVKE